MKRRWSFFSCSCWAWSYSVSDMGFFLTFFFLLAQQTYDANADAVFPKSQVTDFHARFVRVIPEQWHFRPCMKLELKGCEGDFFYIFYWSFCVTRTVEHIVRVNRGVDYQSISFEWIGQFFLDCIGCETWLWLLVKSFLSLRNLCKVCWQYFSTFFEKFSFLSACLESSSCRRFDTPSPIQ